jgi:hypothetical protein
LYGLILQLVAPKNTFGIIYLNIIAYSDVFFKSFYKLFLKRNMPAEMSAGIFQCSFLRRRTYELINVRVSIGQRVIYRIRAFLSKGIVASSAKLARLG